MADTDQAIYVLRYNQVSNQIEGQGGTPSWNPLVLNGTVDGQAISPASIFVFSDADSALNIQGDTYGLATNHNGYGLFVAGGLYSQAQDGSATVIISDPTSSAVIQCATNLQGFLPPVLTTTEKNAIATPAEGLMVYDSTLHALCFYDGSTWQTVATA